MPLSPRLQRRPHRFLPKSVEMYRTVLAQRLREPWTGRSCFLWHSWCCAAVVVFFHFVPRVTLMSLVRCLWRVFSCSLLQSSVLSSQSSLVPSSSLWQPSLSLDTGSSHRQYVHRSRSTLRMAILVLMVVPGRGSRPGGVDVSEGT